jgi:glucose-1-phosphate adenylyltransferase
MLNFHKSNHAGITFATIPVPIKEASRFGVVITYEKKRRIEFEEKPANPRSSFASMG